MPAYVDALYRISFTALGDIGHFRFTSNVNGEAYTLSGDAKIDTAIFDYGGKMSSNGAVPARTPHRPTTSSATSRRRSSRRRAKSLNIAFDPAAVNKVTWAAEEPVEEGRAGHARATEERARSVEWRDGTIARQHRQACEQRLPIYDGKQRFDLVFTPNGTPRRRPCLRGAPRTDLRPQAGRRRRLRDQRRHRARPAAGAEGQRHHPLQVTVPTIVGTAELTSERVDITMPDQQRFALR